jgi:hypothetical protein
MAGGCCAQRDRGRVNHLAPVSRAREGRGHHELASRASRRCRAERHARGESNSWPVDLLFRLFYFVCSFSVGRRGRRWCGGGRARQIR